MVMIILLTLFVGSQSLRFVNQEGYITQERSASELESMTLSELDLCSTTECLLKQYHKVILGFNQVSPMAAFDEYLPSGDFKPQGLANTAVQMGIQATAVQMDAWQAANPLRPTVFCLGDSITEGGQQYLAGNWVNAVSKKRKDLQFSNQGISGEIAYGLLKRLPNVSSECLLRTSAECLPVSHASKQNKMMSSRNYAVIMIGTNDVIGSLNKEDERFSFHSTDCQNLTMAELQKEGALGVAISNMMNNNLVFKRPKILPEEVGPKTVLSLANYEEQLTQAVHHMKDLGYTVAVMSQPPLGEDFSEDIPPASEYGPLEEAANSRTQKYVDIAKKVAGSEGVDYLPLNEKMRELLQSPELAKDAFDQAPDQAASNLQKAYPGLRARLHISGEHTKAKVKPMLQMPPQAVSFDSLTPPELYFLHDFIHPNERGAAVIATVVDEWLSKVAQKR